MIPTATATTILILPAAIFKEHVGISRIMNLDKNYDSLEVDIWRVGVLMVALSNSVTVKVYLKQLWSTREEMRALDGSVPQNSSVILAG